MNYGISINANGKKRMHYNQHEVTPEVLNFGILGDLNLPVFPGKICERIPGIYSDGIVKPDFVYGSLIFSNLLSDMIDDDKIGRDKLQHATLVIKRRKVK